MDIQSSTFDSLFILWPVIIQGWVSPVKPGDLAHGGIPWSIYDEQPNGLECLIDPWKELKARGATMAVDDRVDLYLNNDANAVTGHTVKPGEEQQRILLYVPKGRLNHGVNRFHYKVKRVGGNVSEDSRDLFVLYHLRPADALDLVIPPKNITNGIGPVDGVQGVEFGFTYNNRRAFDRILFLLGDTSVGLDVPAAPAPITCKLFTDTFEKAGDNPSAVAEFQVIDQLGNVVKSPAKSLDIHISRLDLPAPTVKGQTGNNFTPIQQDVSVMVPQGTLLPTDKVHVIWKGAISTPAASFTSPQRLVSSGLEVVVPRSVLAYSLGKQVEVTYVIDRDGVPTTSKTLSLNILPLPVTALISPKIVEADANNVLDVTALGTRNATIHALLWTLIEDGQPCWLSLEGRKPDGTAHNLDLWKGLPAQVNLMWVEEGYWPQTLANSYLKELGDGTPLFVNFKVSMDQSNVEATAQVFPDSRYTIKAVALDEPTITSIKGSPSNVEILPGGITEETSVTLSGAAAKGLNVDVLLDTVSKGQPTADSATGIWTLRVTALPAGLRSFSAVALYGSGQSSVPRTLSVVEPFSLDTSTLQLSGQKFSLKNSGINWTSTGVDPVGTTANRQPITGKTPYTFTGSNANVVTVDSAGLIRSEGNGTATITVKDSLNRSGSFQVVVSNVDQLVQRAGNYSASEIGAWISAQGLTGNLSGHPGFLAYRPQSTDHYWWTGASGSYWQLTVNINGQWSHYGYVQNEDRHWGLAVRRS